MTSFFKWLRDGSAFAVAGVCGVLHRSAATSPWADDRGLSGEPAWFQLAAPAWHAALPDSPSMAATLTSLVDPLTAASYLGDTRGIAALLAAAAAGLLCVVLRRLGVPLVVAALLPLATVGSVLPVTAFTSSAHALQMLAAVSLLWLWMVTPVSWVRLTALAVVTALGVWGHVAFAAFAAALWGEVIYHSAPSMRRRALACGVATLSLSVFAAAASIDDTLLASRAQGAAAPELPSVVAGIFTGRFTSAMQPSRSTSWSEAFAHGAPAPLIVCVPLAVAGFVSPRTRRAALACGVAWMATMAFVGGTWLPDVAVAAGSARIAALVLVALGLSWMWMEPMRGAKGLAAAAGAFIGLFGFLTPNIYVASESAQMQAFVESAFQPRGVSLWSVGRLAIARPLLLRYRDARADARVASGTDVLDKIPEQHALLAFIDPTASHSPGRTWYAPYRLTYDRARSFVDAQPAGRWLAVALRGEAGGGFCRELLERIHVDFAAGQRVWVARLGDTSAAIGADDRLDVGYGQPIGDSGHTSPARFEIDAAAEARIVINGATAVSSPHGMAFAVFDAWQGTWNSWRVDDCAQATPPAIEEGRPRAAFVVPRDQEPMPDIPALHLDPVDVPLRDSGNAWFASGWHGPEHVEMRWSAAHAANVSIVVSHAQTLRVRVEAEVPGFPTSNRLTLSWNGSPVTPVAPFDGRGEWLISQRTVRRGLNTLTLHVDQLVSPAASGHSSDTRLLGAGVRRLTVIPTPDARARGSLTDRR